MVQTTEDSSPRASRTGVTTCRSRDRELRLRRLFMDNRSLSRFRFIRPCRKLHAEVLIKIMIDGRKSLLLRAGVGLNLATQSLITHYLFG